MKLRIFITCFILLIMLGCGQNQQRQLKVTYRSDPPGGTLYRKNGKAWGPCPKVLWYDLSEEAIAAGQLQAKGLIVRWQSGPEKKSEDLIMFPLDGNDQEFTFVQPTKAQGTQQIPENAELEIASEVEVKEEDPGLHEEADEPILTKTKISTTEDPVSVGILEQVDDAQEKSEQDQELRDEPKEEITLIAKQETVENADDGIIERESNDGQIRTEVDSGIHEKSEDTQSRILKKTVNEDTAGISESEQTDPNEMESKAIQTNTEDPNDELVQKELQTKEVDLGDGVKMSFVLIPAGEFKTELDPDITADNPDITADNPDKNSTLQVTISKPFYMGIYEVTQKQYETIMGVNPAFFIDDSNELEDNNRPVESVSWHDAKAFCKKLSTKLKLKFRLPTEAEWEYACRAGTTTKFYWGEEFDKKYAHTIEDRKAGTYEVGSKLPNAWGLHDMSGNVWEWCQDWYGNKKEFRILRGGSWGNSQSSCGSAHRNWHTPNHRYDDCGFRVVMEVESASE